MRKEQILNYIDFYNATPEDKRKSKIAEIADGLGVEPFCRKMNLSELTVVMWREGAIAQPGTLRKIAARLHVPVAVLMK